MKLVLAVLCVPSLSLFAIVEEENSTTKFSHRKQPEARDRRSANASESRKAEPSIVTS